MRGYFPARTGFYDLKISGIVIKINGHICIYIHMCMYVYTYVYIYICIYVYIYICISCACLDVHLIGNVSEALEVLNDPYTGAANKTSRSKTR